MLRKKVLPGVGIRVNESFECKTLMEQLREHKQGGQAVENGRAKIMHTEKKDGVLPISDIRFDRTEALMVGLHEISEGFKRNEEVAASKAAEAEAKAMENMSSQEAGR